MFEIMQCNYSEQIRRQKESGFRLLVINKLKMKKLKKVKIKPIIRTSCKLLAQSITSSEKSIVRIEIHCKSCVNELHKIN